MTHAERCETCADALLDLSEHQPVTIESATPVIAACPACGNKLRRLVRGFALAYELPSEEPTPLADAFVLRRADERHFLIALAAASSARPTVSRLRVRPRSWAPLAIAAAALLVIAIGGSVLRLSPQSQQGSKARPAHPSSVLQPPSERASPKPTESPLEGMPQKETQPPVEQRVAHGPDAVRILSKPEPRERSERAAHIGRSGDDPLPHLRRPRESVPSLADGTSSVESNRCKMRVTVFQKLLARGDLFTPSPAGQLEVGLCYRALGNREAARQWLAEASKHPETKARAMRALADLD